MLALALLLAWTRWSYGPHLLSISANRGTLEFEPEGWVDGKASFSQDDKVVARLDLKSTRRIELPAGKYTMKVIDLDLSRGASGPSYEGSVSVFPGQPTKVRLGILEFAGWTHSGKVLISQDDKVVARLDLRSTRRIELPTADYKLELIELTLPKGAGGVSYEGLISILPGQRKTVWLKVQ